MKSIVIISILFSAVATTGCGRRDKEATPEPEHDSKIASEPEHEHGETHELSDLDRSPVELLTAQCEHDKPTHQCDECRYEVGVVKLDPSLLEGGLFSTATVEEREVPSKLRLNGEVRFDDRAVGHVSTQAEGVVRAVHATLGDAVKAGAPLVELESVEVGQAQAEYLEARGLAQLAKRNLDRVDELRTAGIASERELLEARGAFESAQIRADGTQGRLTRLGAAAGEAMAARSGAARGRLLLRAPLAGSVLVMHAVPGEIARPGEPLVTVGDNAQVWVWADLYERDLAAVTAAQSNARLAAAVSVRAYPDQEFPGVVDLISPSMDEGTRTVKLRVEVANPKRSLLAGMFAKVDIFLPGSERALCVPSEAVQEDEGRSFVFVHREAEFYLRRPVTVGRSFGGLSEITAGLKAGQIVVDRGAFLMKSDVLRAKMGAGCAD